MCKLRRLRYKLKLKLSLELGRNLRTTKLRINKYSAVQNLQGFYGGVKEKKKARAVVDSQDLDFII